MPIQQTYTQLDACLYRSTCPEPMSDARLVHINHALLKQLDIDWTDHDIKTLCTGQTLKDQPEPIAQKYTGHQFGYYNPDLGDGRGVLLGQIAHKAHHQIDLHLKGSGRTPFSRRGDGRAVLRSAIREYLIGEALFYQGIATSRCLSLCHSPEPVAREHWEDRACYLRVAQTHVRFGQFEFLAQQQNRKAFYELADYLIQHNYPELQTLQSKEKLEHLLQQICERTATMIAHWQAAGFCHGVMNTDNMSCAGETFDFGPFAFQDRFSIHFICNHSDTEGRYAYSQQPSIGLWNVQILANAFAWALKKDPNPFIDQISEAYIEHYNPTYLNLMRAKLGWTTPQQNDKESVAETLVLMDRYQLDFHLFFRDLVLLIQDQNEWLKKYPQSELKAWSHKYMKHILQPEQSIHLIQHHTPKLVLRNYMAQEIIAAAEQGDYSLLERMMVWLQTPYTIEQEDLGEKSYYLKAPSAEHQGLTLSCSS